MIGFERESKGQFAGFRTILLISIGSCLMMMLSLHIPAVYRDLGSDSVLRIDPARIASYAIASMGFLGGGAIIKGRGTVRGLTTAASLWLVTGLGLAVGAGFYIPAILCAGISMVALFYLGRFKSIVPHRQFVTLSVSCRCGAGLLEAVKKIVAGHANVNILFVNFQQSKESDTAKYVLRLSVVGDSQWTEIVESIMRLDGARELSWTESDVP